MVGATDAVEILQMCQRFSRDIPYLLNSMTVIVKSITVIFCGFLNLIMTWFIRFLRIRYRLKLRVPRNICN